MFHHNSEIFLATSLVAGDAVSSMETEAFLRYANEACGDPNSKEEGPVIPKGYNRIAEWQIAQGNLSREQVDFLLYINMIIFLPN
jgi:hypothetical protein